MNDMSGRRLLKAARAGSAAAVLLAAAQAASAHVGHQGAPAIKTEVLFDDPSPSAGATSGPIVPEEDSSAAERIVVILANFRDDRSEPVSQEQAGALVSQVSDLYREASYGKSDMGVEVLSWITLDMDSRCDGGKIKDAAIKTVDPEVDFRRFGRVVIIFPNPAESCPFDGTASMGRWPVETGEGFRSLSVTWLPLDPDQLDNVLAGTQAILAQELGHNMGLEHASTLSCGKVALGLNCTDEEYGDPIDPMGDGGPHHFNAVYKRQLGWISEEQVATVERRRGVYTFRLSPLETRGGLKLLKVPSFLKAPLSDSDYHLEFRQPLGWDSLGIEPSNFDGALVRVLLRSNHDEGLSFWQRLPLIGRLFGRPRSYVHTHLLDMDTTLGSGYALRVGQEWTGPNREVSLKVARVVDGELEVVVTIGKPTFQDFVAGIFDRVSRFFKGLFSGDSSGSAVALARGAAGSGALSMPTLSLRRPGSEDTTRLLDYDDAPAVAAPARSETGLFEFRPAASSADARRAPCGGLRQLPSPLRQYFDQEADARGIRSRVSCLTAGEYLANRLHRERLAGDREGAAESFTWEGFLTLRAARAALTGGSTNTHARLIRGFTVCKPGSCRRKVS